MASYATEQEFRDYVQGDVNGSSGEIEKTLQAAERDIDSISGSWSLEANGRKFGSPSGANEKGLSSSQRMALRDATCAQAEWRIMKGPAFFAGAEYDSVSGPDFSVSGKLPRIAPAAKAALSGTRLAVRWAGIV